MTRKECWQEAFATNRIIKDLLLMLVCISCLVLIYRVTFSVDFTEHYWLYDLFGHWALGGYALHGIDPFPQIGAEIALLPEVGKIPAEWGATPWGLLLGQLFYPSYLSFETAKVYFVLLNITCLLCFLYVLHSVVIDISTVDKFLGYNVLILAAVNDVYWEAMYTGNCGGMICVFLIMACLLNLRYPILSGILLGFAMVKPQTALLFCLAMLLAGRWKTLLTTSVMVIASWAFVALQVDTGFLELLSEFLTTNIGGGRAYPGIMEPFRVHYPQLNVMPLSILFGVLFVWLMWRNRKGQTLYLYPLSLAAIATAFWCYTWLLERTILLLPAIVSLYFSTLEHSEREKLVFWCIAFYCSVNRTIITSIKILANSINAINIDFYNAITIYHLGLILCCLYLCRYGNWKKLDEDFLKRRV
ncbi:MAG: DUF2029 domain-containing protein [Selenomonadaceae bacterium]|nr:DUF2029 domain-containing protein [Selenomonadaceae bacterium]